MQSSSEVGDDIEQNSLSSRLVLLALHFPRLRIIWSRSLHATAEIFRNLKSNFDEPDAVTAAAIGDSMLQIIWLNLPQAFFSGSLPYGPSFYLFVCAICLGFRQWVKEYHWQSKDRIQAGCKRWYCQGHMALSRQSDAHQPSPIPAMI